MQTMLSHLGKLTAALLLLAAVLSWWLAPSPQAPTPSRTQDTSWRLPARASGHAAKSAEASVATIAAANLWGTVPAASTEALIAPDWRFSGVAVNGQEKLVMIMVAGQTMKTLKAGDQLPGGAKILKINDDHLCLLINGKKRKLDVF